MNKHEEFLNFNGKSLSILKSDGNYWVALKPIADALNVNWNRLFQNIKEHKFYGRVFAIQQMHDSTNRLQKMVSLPERYVYGWIFQINSSSEELAKFQQTCHDILYDHFHGTITRRNELIIAKYNQDMIVADNLEKLKEENEFYKRAEEGKALSRLYTREIKKIDSDYAKQTSMFN